MSYKGIYKVGDVCVGRGFRLGARDSHFNGMECEIVRDFGTYEVTIYKTAIEARFDNSYRVKWVNGEETITPEKNLKLKRHPEELSSWKIIGELLGYNPFKRRK